MTQNSWNNQVTAANVTFTGGTMSIGTDATDNAIDIGTAASAGRTVTIGNATGTSTVAVNCGTGGVTLGTSATAHATTVGSTNSTSSTTLQSGSGALAVTSANGTLTINSGTGALGISTDASATTVSFATGGGNKLVSLGSTSGASSLALKTGTADFSLASATGTIISALDTGEITCPLQVAFLAYLGSTDLNKTGNGTAFTLGSSTALTEVFDQNSDFNTNGTFTAPVTGRYQLSASAYYTGCTIATTFQLALTTSNRTFFGYLAKAAGAQDEQNTVSVLCDMDAADTATVVVTVSGEAGDTVDILGFGAITQFGGFLAC